MEAKIQMEIEEHNIWKQHLREAIVNGRSDFSPIVVRQDNHCSFGKWLNSLDEPTKSSDRWKWINATHAAFHWEAGRILACSLAGNRKEAEAMLSVSSKFAELSGN